MLALFFTWRIGDEVADGGHIIVTSIGQVIPSSTKMAVSSATERSGNGQTVPITWHKVKNKNTRKKYRVLTRRIMGPTSSRNTHSTSLPSL